MSYRYIDANDLIGKVDFETQNFINEMPCIYADIKPLNQHINIDEIRDEERTNVLKIISEYKVLTNSERVYTVDEHSMNSFESQIRADEREKVLEEVWRVFCKYKQDINDANYGFNFVEIAFNEVKNNSTN